MCLYLGWTTCGRKQALSIGERFLELDILMENLPRETPLYVIIEGSKPQCLTRFFTAKSTCLRCKVTHLKGGCLYSEGWIKTNKT